MKTNSSLIDNISFLSAAAKYNSERRVILGGAFDHFLLSGRLFTKSISEEAIRDYYQTEQPIDQGDLQSIFRMLQLIQADDPDSQTYQAYLFLRYSPRSEDIRDKLGFSAVDMVSLEAMIHNLIYERAEEFGIRSDFHVFENKQQLAELVEFETPTKVFEDRWFACIQFEKNDLIAKFLAQIGHQELPQELGIDKTIDVANDIISTLSIPLDESIDYEEYQFFKTPIFELDENRLVIPFPNFLVNTAQLRIEELIQQDERLQKIEDQRKGDLVEELVVTALKSFESRNLIHSFHFNNPDPGETDALLFFEDSYWAVEVKSHPIFRKLPGDIDTAIHRFQQKSIEAIDQGQRAIDYLEHNESLFYNLTGKKSPKDFQKGTIVLLDGLIPTLFSQNRRVDQYFGISEIYDSVSSGDRVYILTLFDLFELSNQVEELDRLEEFLIWRTEFGFDMPVHAFNEREYWAMYFDNYAVDEDFRQTIDDAAERDIVVNYISQRFNDKPHLPEQGFQ